MSNPARRADCRRMSPTKSTVIRTTRIRTPMRSPTFTDLPAIAPIDCPTVIGQYDKHDVDASPGGTVVGRSRSNRPVGTPSSGDPPVAPAPRDRRAGGRRHRCHLQHRIGPPEAWSHPWCVLHGGGIVYQAQPGIRRSERWELPVHPQWRGRQRSGLSDARVTIEPVGAGGELRTTDGFPLRMSKGDIAHITVSFAAWNCPTIELRGRTTIPIHLAGPLGVNTTVAVVPGFHFDPPNAGVLIGTQDQTRSDGPPALHGPVVTLAAALRTQRRRSGRGPSQIWEAALRLPSKNTSSPCRS